MNIFEFQSNNYFVVDKKKIFTGVSLTLLAITAALINLWQSYRGIPLIDYAYQADAAYRIYQGEIPYRDFFLVLPPGIYYYMALIMSLTGGYNHLAQVFGTMIVSAMTILVSYFVIQKITRSTFISLIFTFPLIFSGHSIYAFPNYDISACLFILLTLLIGYIAQSSPQKTNILGFFSGITAATTTLVKQNVGIPFIFLWLAGLFFVYLISGNKRGLNFAIWSSIGVVLVISAFLTWLAKAGAITSFYFQTFEFPARVRNPISGLLIMRSEFGSFIFYFFKEFVAVLTFFAIIGLFAQLLSSRLQKEDEITRVRLTLFFSIFVTLLFGIGLVYSFFFISEVFIISFLWLIMMIFSFSANLINVFLSYKNRNITFLSLAPFICLILCLFSSLSQGFWGSSYGIWPLFVIQCAWFVNLLSPKNNLIPWNNFILLLMLFLSVFFFRHILSQSRLWSYVDLYGKTNSTDLLILRGFQTPGDWLPNFENLVNYVNEEIPRSDSVAFLPGEDIFFIVTERKNPLSCNQFLENTCDYSVDDAIMICKQQKIEWLVLKNNFQLRSWKNFDKYPNLKNDESYEYFGSVNGYDIFKLRST